LRLASNLGYAGNNNVGIRRALSQGAEWVFVLNEDVLLAPDALRRLIEVAEAEPTIGIVGPTVYHHNEPRVIQSAGGTLGPGWLAVHRGQNEPDRGQYGVPVPVEWISGCAILVRRELIEQVGALDDRFFYYWEETEWCLRARRQGWQVVFVPQARVWHKGVQREYRPSPAITYYWTRNWLLMLAKHHAPLRTWLSAVGQLLRSSLAWTIRPKWRTMRGHREAMWQGMRDFLRRRWGMRPS
jgi:GT2 family glycosyltransferase